MTKHNCKKCNRKYNGNVCPECGQKPTINYLVESDNYVDISSKSINANMLNDRKSIEATFK